MLPMTFQVEGKQRREALARRGMILQIQKSSPATFFSFLATSAAHRSLLLGSRADATTRPDMARVDLLNDREYALTQYEATAAVKRKLDNQTIDRELVDACFGLVSTAVLVGNFWEARTHLQGIQVMVDRIGPRQESSESVFWLPIADVTAALGMLSRPVLPLPWARTPIPNTVLSHISSAATMDMARLGSGFLALADLSDQLQSLLVNCRDICLFCECNALDSVGLSPEEHSVLRRKAVELQHDLLSYPSNTISPVADTLQDVSIAPLEAVVRLAMLGLLTIVPHRLLPWSGVSRALSRHQMAALKQWMRQTAAGDSNIAELNTIVWALFIFAQLAVDKPEEPFFILLLAQYTRQLWLVTWEDTETTMFAYLYIPQLQAGPWRKIWDLAQKAGLEKWSQGLRPPEK